jgi:hypothetical protein
MSSAVHARCKTIDKASLMDAAKDLNIKIVENQDGSVTYMGTKFSFDTQGNTDVQYYKDHSHEAKVTKQLAQLGTFFTTMKRLKTAGLVCTKSTKDVVAAVKAGQKLTLEFEEQTAQTVKA